MVGSDDSFPYVDFAYVQWFFNYVFASGSVSDGTTGPTTSFRASQERREQMAAAKRQQEERQKVGKN